jgi:hypothetical protein
MWPLLSDFQKWQKHLGKDESWRKLGKRQKKLSLCGKRQKYLTKVPPFHHTFAGVEVSCWVILSGLEVNSSLYVFLKFLVDWIVTDLPTTKAFATNRTRSFVLQPII